MERLKRGTEPGGGPLCTSPPPQPGPRCLTSCPPPPHFRDHPRAGAGAGVLGRDRAQRPHVTAAPRPPRAPPVAPQERGHPRGSPPPPNPPAFINKGRAASPPLKGNSPSKEKNKKTKEEPQFPQIHRSVLISRSAAPPPLTSALMSHPPPPSLYHLLTSAGAPRAVTSQSAGPAQSGAGSEGAERSRREPKGAEGLRKEPKGAERAAERAGGALLWQRGGPGRSGPGRGRVNGGGPRSPPRPPPSPPPQPTRRHADQGVPHPAAHEPGGVPGSAALHDPGAAGAWAAARGGGRVGPEEGVVWGLRGAGDRVEPGERGCRNVGLRVEVRGFEAGGYGGQRGAWGVWGTVCGLEASYGVWGSAGG